MKKMFSVFVLLILISGCGDKDGNVSPNSQDEHIPIVSANAIYDVTIIKNITYAEGLSHQIYNGDITTTLSLKLDAYIPENNINNRPAILLIHGGAFIGGTKEDSNIVNLVNYFASRGWAAFSISYRLRRDKGTVPNEWLQYAEENLTTDLAVQTLSLYPANRDAKAAIRWLYANANTYSINTDYITVGGGSAGAVTANMIGVTEAEDYSQEISVDEDHTLLTTNLDQPSKVHTILDFWGSNGTINALEKIYGLNRFDKADAPILIAHGTEDMIVYFNRAEELRDHYISTGVNYKFYPLAGLGHGPWHATVNGKSLSELSFDFIVEQQGLKKQ